MPVQLGIPFVTGAFRGEPALGVDRAFEDGGTICVCTSGSANVNCQDIADARQGILGIDWLGREDFRTWQALLVIIGIKTGGDSQLPKIVQASRIEGFRLATAQSRQ